MIGDILVIKHNNLFSNFVHWYTKSDCDHVGLFIDNKYFIESTLKGVAKNSLQYYIRKQEKGKLTFSIYRVKGITEKEAKIVANFAEKQLGKPYDLVQFVCVSILYLFKKLRKFEPIDLTGWLCSELVAESFYEIKIKFKEDVDPDNIIPKDIVSSLLVEKIN